MFAEIGAEQGGEVMDIDLHARLVNRSFCQFVVFWFPVTTVLKCQVLKMLDFMKVKL